GVDRRRHGRRAAQGVDRGGARCLIRGGARAYEGRRKLWERRGAAAGASHARHRGRRGTTQTSQAPRQATRAEAAELLEGAHPIVLRVVLDLRKIERFEERWHVHAEP